MQIKYCLQCIRLRDTKEALYEPLSNPLLRWATQVKIQNERFRFHSRRWIWQFYHKNRVKVKEKQQSSFNSYSQPYQLAQNSLPNSGSDVGNNGSISKTQKYVLSGNSNLFNPNQKIGNSSIFQSMSNNFQQKRKNFFNKLGYPAGMSLRDRGVRLIENGAYLIFDTFTDKTPEYIPTTEPTNFQTSIKQMSMYPKFQSSSEYIQQSLNGNELDKQERINAYKSGKKIYINLADKEYTGFAIKDNHDDKILSQPLLPHINLNTLNYLIFLWLLLLTPYKNQHFLYK